MAHFVRGANRQQATLLPECLEDWVDEDNPVRVIDVFVDGLDLRTLGFDGVDPADTGRPAYHPAALLKLYVYGYLNRVASSRRLEREAGRNLELMWLLGRLVPDHKTIANFRKDNGKAIRKVCAHFVELCRKLGLLTKASVAIDGSKFKAVNNRDRNFTTNKMERRLAQIDESVTRYLNQLDSADRQAPSAARFMKKLRLKEKLEKLGEEVKRLRHLKYRMRKEPDEQISLTDPDCRSMATSGRGSGVVGYNVQIAVDTEHHLIVAHEVTNVGNDTEHLATMAKKAKDALRAEELEAVADRGYFKNEEVLACEQAGITATLPKPMTSGNTNKKQFTKADFRYLPEDDVYLCPADARLTKRRSKRENGQKYFLYFSDACSECALKDQCTATTGRQVSRWEHEDVIERVQERLDMDPDAMRRRRETVEHPFGTIKDRMGATHFKMKTLPKVATEMALHVLAYNLTRLMNILGIGTLLKAMNELRV